MRVAGLLIAAAAVAAAQVVSSGAGPPPTPSPASAPEDLCTIAGQVLNTVSNEPLRRVTLLLMRADPTPGEPPVTYTTASDAGGAFSMKNIEPGRYRLTASRNGYVPYTYGARGAQRPGTVLSLARQQHVTDLSLKLTPHGVLTGRIMDDEGEPV